MYLVQIKGIDQPVRLHNLFSSYFIEIFTWWGLKYNFSWSCVNIKTNNTVTPFKTFTRIHLTPSTKEFLCIVCGEKIENAQYRLRCKNIIFWGKISTHIWSLNIIFLIKRLKQSIAMPVTAVLTQCDFCQVNVKVKKFNQARVLTMANGLDPDQARQNRQPDQVQCQTVWTQIRPQKIVGPIRI